MGVRVVLDIELDDEPTTEDIQRWMRTVREEIEYPSGPDQSYYGRLHFVSATVTPTIDET